MGWSERWSKVVSYYLYEINTNDRNMAQQKIRGAIDYYVRQSRFFYSLNEIIVFGVLVNCASNLDFQKAFLSLSLQKVWNINPLGAILLIVFPFSYGFYLLKFGFNIGCLENVLAQFDLDDIS